MSKTARSARPYSETWKVDKQTAEVYVESEWRGAIESRVIAECHGMADEAGANARLIAQVPAMLNWLKRFARWERTAMNDDELRELFAEARALLRAVEGEK